jgi:cytochrome c553
MSRRPRTVALLTLAWAAVAAVLAGVAVVASGLVSVSAVPPHFPLTRLALQVASDRSIAVHAASYTAPADFLSDGRVALGARHYANECSKCHGAPGLGQNPVPLSMRPRPPYLPAVVGNFDDAELFWVVKNGIRFTGMPAWPAEGRDDEIWSVVAFLHRMPAMSTEDYLAMVTPPGDAPTLAYGAPGPSRPAEIPPGSGPTENHGYFVPTSGFVNADYPLSIETCAACHGLDGRGAPTLGEAPNLSIQDQDYLAASLRAFATGERRSGFMEPVAASLSDSQITGLARYFADQPARPAATGGRDLDRLALGQTIAREGVPARALPACLDCHERNEAVDAPIEVPRLSGQSEPYLERQLMAFADGGRGATEVYNPMPGEVHGLTAEEMKAVAAYFAAQPPSGPERAAAEATAPAPEPAVYGSLCVACHRPDAVGSGSGTYPNLTLQTAPYVEQALYAYRTGERANLLMDEAAHTLDDGQIRALADYLGGLEPVTPPAETSEEAVARGAEIARNGVPETSVPACLTCHGPRSTALLPLTARLHGQHARYLAQKLDDYAASDQGEGGSLINPMPGIARGLTDAQRADVAAWFAAQTPLPKDHG